MAELSSDPIENNDGHKKGHHHHVHRAHFVEEHEQDAHDSKILVEPLGDQSVNVRLGFLQVRHIYEVHFVVEDGLGEDVTFDPLESLHAQIESANPSEDGKGHDIVLRFNAAKEKIMQESVSITSKDGLFRKLTMEIHARVLGKGKGTPSLKEGIHCIRIEGDEDTDDSDWQGF